MNEKVKIDFIHGLSVELVSTKTKIIQVHDEDIQGDFVSVQGAGLLKHPKIRIQVSLRTVDPVIIGNGYTDRNHTYRATDENLISGDFEVTDSYYPPTTVSCTVSMFKEGNDGPN